MDWQFVRTSLVVSSLFALAIGGGLAWLTSVFTPGSAGFTWSMALRWAVLLEFAFLVIFLMPYINKARKREGRGAGPSSR